MRQDSDIYDTYPFFANLLAQNYAHYY